MKYTPTGYPHRVGMVEKNPDRVTPLSGFKKKPFSLPLKG